jgi:hypothetical protein
VACAVSGAALIFVAITLLMVVRARKDRRTAPIIIQDTADKVTPQLPRHYPPLQPAPATPAPARLAAFAADDKPPLAAPPPDHVTPVVNVSRYTTSTYSDTSGQPDTSGKSGEGAGH